MRRSIAGPSPEDPDAEPQDPALTLNVDAEAKITITPELEIGLFGSGGDRFGAEAAVKATLNLIGQANLKGRWGWGGGNATKNVVEPIPTTESCQALITDPESDDWGPTCCAESGIPACMGKEVCAEKHHLQIDFSFLADLTVMMKMYAKASFGPWNKVFNVKRWFASESPSIRRAAKKYLDWNVHLATMCIGDATDQEPASTESNERGTNPSPIALL